MSNYKRRKPRTQCVGSDPKRLGNSIAGESGAKHAALIEDMKQQAEQELPPLVDFSDEFLERLAALGPSTPNIPYPEDDDL